MYDTELMRDGRFIDALSLRANVFGVRVVLAQVKSVEDVKCRGCSVKPESLGHVLGECYIHKPKRIHKHNEIVGCSSRGPLS